MWKTFVSQNNATLPNQGMTKSWAAANIVQMGCTMTNWWHSLLPYSLLQVEIHRDPATTLTCLGLQSHKHQAPRLPLNSFPSSVSTQTRMFQHNNKEQQDTWPGLHGATRAESFPANSHSCRVWTTRNFINNLSSLVVSIKNYASTCKMHETGGILNLTENTTAAWKSCQTQKYRPLFRAKPGKFLLMGSPAPKMQSELHSQCSQMKQTATENRDGSDDVKTMMEKERIQHSSILCLSHSHLVPKW